MIESTVEVKDKRSFFNEILSNIELVKVEKLIIVSHLVTGIDDYLLELKFN
ncbi:hypothetical protein [Oceanobacillus sp. CFH 90083]|uniref:hypothetical protein n=1 Tax=Oceanobacillus sp. CFH 90083 TaxID=2592336 RepID=UPI001884329D|nr:hypothetical protein [Oceanobacillus sp. CFH 90083]